MYVYDVLLRLIPIRVRLSCGVYNAENCAIYLKAFVRKMDLRFSLSIVFMSADAVH